MKYIKSSALWHLCREGAEVNILYCEKGTGMLTAFNKWVVSSWHSRGSTLNLRNPQTSEYRKLRRILIVRFNGVKVIL
jgi:hypothetical protein